MPELKPDEALYFQPEWCRVILDSIGDAVVAADTEGRVTFLNPVAESLTGWMQDEAAGVSLESVFKIVNEGTRKTVESPTVRALLDGVVVGLANHTLLIAKDGTERPIDDSAAPIRNDQGEVIGAVLVFRDVTERRRQEQHLQDALTYADNIIATMREPFVVLDTNLRIVTANHSFYQNFLVTPEETEGQFVYDLGNRQWDIPRLRILLEEVLPKNNVFQDFEMEHDFPAIGRRIMLLNARRIRKPGNNSKLILLAIEDITERRRQEQHLQDALTYADNIIATMREPFVVLDKTLRIKTANQTFYNTFHVQKEETEGRFIYDLGNGQWNIPRLRTLLDEVLSDHHPVHDFEMEHDFPAIGKKIMLLNARRFESVHSQSGLILLAIEDITDRNRQEQSLHDALTYADNIIATMREPFVVLDTNLRIVTANRSFYQNFHVTPEETEGQFIYDLGNHQWDISRLRILLEEVLPQNNAFQDFEVEHDFPAIGRKNMLLNARRIRKPGSHSELILLAIEDITERSRLERKTKEQAEALADLQRRKDEFLAMLSHELRNPLAPISNAVQLLRLQKTEGQIQQQARSIIERQVRQLTRLVDDLLDVSRISTGKINLQQERVALNGIVENGVETVRTLIGQRRHVLTVSLPPQPIWLHADASRLEQVVVNLLTNAAKYTDEGGHIWLTVQEEGEDCVLRVRDTGVGIAPELLPRIFDLFTQAERSLDRSQGGLGIGLTLVQRLVETHGGNVSVQSVLGQGSEFIVRLPVTLTPAPQPPSTHEETAEPTGPSLRVLVVDDNVDSAETLGMLLKASGHDVRTAYDGPTALAAALDYRPDVVLLDIGLPGFDGYEVVKRLRQQPVLHNIVLVAMTGYGQESDRQRSQEAGFDHHLAKPVDFGKVEQILATVSKKTT